MPSSARSSPSTVRRRAAPRSAPGYPRRRPPQSFAWYSFRSSGSRGYRLSQMPVDLLFGVRLAFEFEHAVIVVDDAVQRHADLPWPREDGRVLDRGFVAQVVRAGRRVTLGDLRVVAEVVAGPIEPRLAVQARDLDDERVAFPVR